MKKLLKTIAIPALLGASFFAVSPSIADGGDYSAIYSNQEKVMKMMHESMAMSQQSMAMSQESMTMMKSMEAKMVKMQQTIDDLFKLLNTKN